MDGDERESDLATGETTPATTTVLVERAGHAVLAEGSDMEMDPEDADDGSEGEMGGSGDEEEEDAERDEAIARQIIVSQGIETSFGVRSDTAADPSLAATGNGCFQPPGDDDDDDCDGCGDDDDDEENAADVELDDRLRVEIPVANPSALLIKPKGFLVDLSERLATVLLDIRVDPQMFEEL